MNAMATSPNRPLSFTGLAQRLGLALVVFLCTALTSVVWADPPGRVGRLGEMTGQVWLFAPDSGEWVAAPRNQPLTTGDRVATDADSHAEVRIGSTTVRLDAGTELEVLRIDDEHMALQLHGGAVAVRLRNTESAREFELRTVEGRFVANQPGRYRFDRADDTSHVTVLNGEAVFEGPGSALTVYPNQRADFWLDNNAAQYSITDPVRDAFASWSGDADRRDERPVSTRYVSPEMTGSEDLDRYGRWEQAPDYGPVWIPRAVPVEWAPYQVGHWAYISPWGWTWVDDQPWGFAPFHYGRWAMYRERWCWVPGTYVRRPVYAPALVAWVGGPHLSVSISVGNTAPAVGWFPLAPREVFVPTYRVSPHYVQQVNITHVTNITNITTIVNNPQQAVVDVDYRNRRLPHAVTIVPQTVLVNRQPVGPEAGRFRDSGAQRSIVDASQKVVVSAPPVPTPAVDEVRRRHGFANTDGPRGGAASPGGARPQAAAQSVASTSVNIPPPPTRVALPGARPGAESEGRGRAPADQRRGDVRDDARAAPAPAAGVQRPGVMPNPAAPNAAQNAGPNAAPAGQGGRPNAPGNAGDERRGRPQVGVPLPNQQAQPQAQQQQVQQAPQPAVPPPPGQRMREGPAPAPERAAAPAVTPPAPAKPPVVAPVAPAATPQAAAPVQAPVRAVPPPPRAQPAETMRQDSQRRDQRQQEVPRQPDVQRQQEAQRQQDAAQRQQEAQLRQQEAAQARQRAAAPPPPQAVPREAVGRPQAEPPRAHVPAPQPAPAPAEVKPVPGPASEKGKEPPAKKPEARGPASHEQQLAREEQRQRGDDERHARRQGGDQRER